MLVQARGSLEPDRANPDNRKVLATQEPVPIIATGLNHRSAGIDLRERAAFAPELLPAALSDLRAQPAVEEGLIVSTCNRTEIYTVGGDPAQLQDWIARQRDLPREAINRHSYVKTDAAAASHALRVACGLDSLVLGEPQILGQMKSAWQLARERGALGPVLERLFQHAFGTAKVVRHATALGAGQVSVASCAARIASEIFGTLAGKDVLILGAGETAALMARYLGDMGEPRLTIANRRLERAQHLARTFDAAACPLEAFPRFLASADVVVGALTTEQPLVTPALLRQAFAGRRRKPVLMLDLGVPRNFDADVARDEDVFLYGVDDLQSRVERGAAQRASAADAAERIVSARTAEFTRWLQGREIDLGLAGLEQQWHGDLADLRERALARLDAGADPRAVLDRLQYNAIRRLLHSPRRHLRGLPEAERAAAVRALARAFAADDNAPDDDTP